MLAALDRFVCFYRGKCAHTNPADDGDGDVERSPTSANPKYEWEQSQQGLGVRTIMCCKARVCGRQKNSSPLQCDMPDSWSCSTKIKTLTPTSFSTRPHSAHAWPLSRASSGFSSPPSLLRSTSQNSFHSVLSQCSTDCGGEANNFYRLLDADPEMRMLIY